MSDSELWIAAFVVGSAGLAVGYTAWKRRPTRAQREAQNFEVLRRAFHRERERVEAKFVELASSGGKPRGLRWKDCDFEDGVAYARDRKSGELCAFVAVTVSFEAIEGGGMEDVEAVGNLRAATAVFRHKDRHWTTDGRVIFNLKPVQAIAHFQDSLVLVGEEV
jgi:uncharacterized membrane protein YsdA (DUF1294 family)